MFTYVSIDVETTGLDPQKNQIVEVGAVIDRLESPTPISELPTFRAVIMHEEIYINTVCADLHRDLWLEMLAAKRWMGNDEYITGVYDVDNGKVRDTQHTHTHYCQPEKLECLLHTWLCKHLRKSEKENEGSILSEPIKINVAGKNAGTFDIPFLKALPNWEGLVDFNRRVLDPVGFFVQESDEVLPNLQECLSRAGIDRTTQHTAVADALDVIILLRHVRK